MSDTFNSLEQYIVEKLKEIDPTARRTRGSGCGNQIGDVQSKYFWCEAKQKHTKANFIIDRKEDWLKIANKVPVYSLKEIFVIIENKFGEKMICMESESFFRLVKLAYGEER